MGLYKELAIEQHNDMCKEKPFNQFISPWYPLGDSQVEPDDMELEKDLCD